MNITEHPLLRRGPSSASFDAEGVSTTENPLVAKGTLQRYVLGSYSARKLQLQSTGNAGGVRNLAIESGDLDFEDMLQTLGTGLLVTDLMGQGVSVVTGDYSRGAAGFWVEDGVLAYPVEAITIASRLQDMYAGLLAVGTDQDRRSGLMTGSWLIERMTIAGS